MSISFEGSLTRHTSKKDTHYYYSLSGTTLIIFKKQNGVVKSQISLNPDCSVTPNPKHPTHFTLKTPSHTYKFIASTEEDAQSWTRAIRDSLTKHISLDDFQILSVIGRGGYGKVQLVKKKDSGKLYAMKTISKKKIGDEHIISQTISERNILIEIEHPFLIAARFTFQTETHLVLILDYAPGGELFARLKEEMAFSEARVRLYAAELALALGYLHANNIIYRDMKPENVLLDEDGHIRLTDFGLALELEGKNDRAQTFCGTPEYIAPEIIKRVPYDKAVDWWSYGVLLFEMLVGVPPFVSDNVNSIYSMIVNDPIIFPSSMSAQARDFIAKLLNKDPKKRLGGGEGDLKEIMGHPFFEGLNWKDVLNKKIEPKWKPKIKSVTDTSHFDEEYTNLESGLTFEDPNLIDGDTQEILRGFTYQPDETLDNL